MMYHCNVLSPAPFNRLTNNRTGAVPETPVYSSLRYLRSSCKILARPPRCHCAQHSHHAMARQAFRVVVSWYLPAWGLRWEWLPHAVFLPPTPCSPLQADAPSSSLFVHISSIDGRFDPLNQSPTTGAGLSITAPLVLPSFHRILSKPR